MKFNDWFKWNYDVDDLGIDDSVRRQVIADSKKYLQKISDRGWKPYAVISLSKDSWMLLGKEDNNDGFNIPYTVTEWCEKNCIGNWDAQDPVWWEMELEEDALSFKLYWG